MEYYVNELSQIYMLKDLKYQIIAKISVFDIQIKRTTEKTERR